MARQLPRYMGVKSQFNNKYLCYQQQAGPLQRLLKFSGETVVSPYTRYEVEASSGKQGLVHIRCCYSNKYWIRESQSSNWILAAADAPEEDQSKWSCTLFEPQFANDGTVRLLHVQLQRYACLQVITSTRKDCLIASASKPATNKSDVFKILDWDTLVILPKHIAFKGDNGKYLSSRWIEKHEYLQFISDDIGDPLVRQQVFYTRDGYVRIMADRYNKFWRRSPNWIWSDSADTTSNNPDTLFWPVKVGDNVIALRNEGNKNFCKGLTTEGKTNCLNAAVPTITKEARLEIEELLISRSIYNVKFHLTDARIYNQNLLTMATGIAVNETQEPNEVDLKFSYTETTSSTWNSSTSLKLGTKTTLQTGIPLIFKGKVEISGEVAATYQWGQTRTSTNVVETTYKVTVPPMTIVRVGLLATNGTCDVPFSYTQHDVRTDGQEVTYFLDDGIYTGSNCYNFKYEAKEEPLTA